MVLLVLSTSGQKKKKTVDTSKVATGIIIGSISLENRKRIVESRWFYFSNESIDHKIKYQEWKRGRGADVKRKYCVMITNSKPEYKIGKTKVYFFKIEQPIGDYKFYEIMSFLNSGYMQSAWVMNINVPFKIEENKTTYIGNFIFNEKGQTFKVNNNFKEDSTRFAKNYPKFDLSNAQ